MSCRAQATPALRCRVLGCTSQIAPTAEAFMLHFQFAHVWAVNETLSAELVRLFTDPDCPTFTLYEAMETARSLARA